MNHLFSTLHENGRLIGGVAIFGTISSLVYYRAPVSRLVNRFIITTSRPNSLVIRVYTFGLLRLNAYSPLPRDANIPRRFFDGRFRGPQELRNLYGVHVRIVILSVIGSSAVLGLGYILPAQTFSEVFRILGDPSPINAVWGVTSQGYNFMRRGYVYILTGAIGFVGLFMNYRSIARNQLDHVINTSNEANIRLEQALNNPDVSQVELHHLQLVADRLNEDLLATQAAFELASNMTDNVIETHSNIISRLPDASQVMSPTFFNINVMSELFQSIGLLFPMVITPPGSLASSDRSESDVSSIKEETLEAENANIGIPSASLETAEHVGDSSSTVFNSIERSFNTTEEVFASYTSVEELGSLLPQAGIRQLATVVNGHLFQLQIGDVTYGPVANNLLVTSRITEDLFSAAGVSAFRILNELGGTSIITVIPSGIEVVGHIESYGQVCIVLSKAMCL